MTAEVVKNLKSAVCFLMAASCLSFIISCADAGESGTPADAGDKAEPSSTAEVALEFSGANALTFVYEQLAMGPRTSKDARQIKLRDRLAEKLKALGFTVEIQPLAGTGGMGAGVNFYNVIATLDSPVNTKYRIFGAHYDTIPIAPNDPDISKRGTPIDGANDGASGVAVLMELARVVSAKKAALKHSIKLIFFDGEDFYTGTDNMFYGSRYFAGKLSKADIATIEYFILLDMIGDADLNIYQDINSLNAYPALTTKIFAAAERLGLKGFYASPKYQIIDDHIPFINAGVPSAVLIDFDFPYWHTISDTGDKVSAASLEQCGKLVEYLVFEN